jgi:RND family efflux transporter MFP subunit
MFAASPSRRPLTRPAAGTARWGRLALPALALAALAAGCTHAPPPKADKTVEVVVTTPITDSVVDYEDFTGRLDAVATVEIRPRVSGYIDTSPFREGDRVEKDQVLFHIDSRTYLAELAQAEANLKLAQADRTLQLLNSERARLMVGSRAIGKEEFDTTMGKRETSKATVLAMEAARDRASVMVGYTYVRAPLTGRISRRVVDPGNLVRADETLLTTIVADDQVFAYFDVDERTYLELLSDDSRAVRSAAAYALAGAHTNLGELGLAAWVAARPLSGKRSVLMKLANEDAYTRTGYVDFVDNRINGNTGTIRMRGVFDNPRGNLKSGLFVRIRLPVGSPYQPLIVPDEALQSDQGKKYVYVVDADNKVQYRSVELGQAIGGLRVIKEGLKEGDLVVVSGQQRVRPGQEVQAKRQPPPQAPGSPMLKQLGILPDRPAAGPAVSASKGQPVAHARHGTHP